MLRHLLKVGRNPIVLGEIVNYSRPIQRQIPNVAARCFSNDTTNKLLDGANKKVLSGSDEQIIIKPTTPIQEGPLPISVDNLKWEVASPMTGEVVIDKVDTFITGAIIPWCKLNFLQKLILPYTFTVMYYLDFLSNQMPWWMAIVTATATFRILFAPIVVKLNKIGIISYNLLPQTQKIQAKMNEAMVSGDAYNQAMCKTKLYLLYKENNITMKQRIVPLLLQAPMYASMFFLLRALTGVPVEGLSTGGALWFTDLTVPDPYYILPTLTCTSLFLLLEFGLEGGVNPGTGMTPIGRYVIRGLPVVMFAFIQSFPAATLLFWSTSNTFTLVYALILKLAWVKKKLNIPDRLVHKPEDLPISNMSFKGQLKKAVEQGTKRRTSLDVRRLDDIAFRKAGIGPLQKTYTEPPKI